MKGFLGKKVIEEESIVKIFLNLKLILNALKSVVYISAIAVMAVQYEFGTDNIKLVNILLLFLIVLGIIEIFLAVISIVEEPHNRLSTSIKFGGSIIVLSVFTYFMINIYLI